MDDFIEKIPNWLRFILAIPFGIICLILVYYVGYFANLWIAAPDSLMIKFYTYLYNNGINAIILIMAMNYMLPKYQFKFTVAVSIIFCSLGLMGFGISLITETLTIPYIIGTFLTIGCFIWSCYYTFKEFEVNYKVVKEDKYEKLSK